METEIIAIILASLALIGTCCSYIIHDRKIKKQQALIQKYEIQKIAKEKEKSKKASLDANVINKSSRKKTIIISNKGMSDAKNVIVKFPKIDKIFSIENPSPFDLTVDSNIKINLTLSEGKSEIFEVEIEWQDDFKEKNKASQTIQI